MAANGMDFAWGQQHIRVTGIIGALSLVVLFLGLALGWLVWSVGMDHRGMVTTFGEVRKEQAQQFLEIRAAQAEMERRFRAALDELAWILTLSPAERETLRHRMQEPERFRRRE